MTASRVNGQARASRMTPTPSTSKIAAPIIRHQRATEDRLELPRILAEWSSFEIEEDTLSPQSHIVSRSGRSHGRTPTNASFKLSPGYRLGVHTPRTNGFLPRGGYVLGAPFLKARLSATDFV